MPAKPDEFDRNAVIAIQGGGVYGLGLLGQLSAVVERRKIEPLALSGTSAGAIIATLYWAGLKPREIRERFLSLAPDEAGAAAGGETLTDLLGPFEPARRPFDFERFRRLAGRVEWILGGRPGRAEPEGGEARPSGFRRLAKALGRPARATRAAAGAGWWWLRFARQALGIAREVGPRWRHRGLFSGARLEQVVDEWIRSSPRLRNYQADLPADGLLTFGLIRDLQRAHADDPDLYYPPLILTATNLTTRKLVLINSFDDDFAEVPIARAVRASAGYPLFFRPVSIACRSREGGMEPGWYVDGGVIANFPAWVFSAEFRQRMRQFRVYRGLASRPWINIGLREIEDPAPPRAAGPVAGNFLGSLLALLAGQVRNELERALAASLPRSVAIEQPESETTAPGNFLDVDRLDKPRIRAMFGHGQEYAEQALETLSFSLPRGKEAERIVGCLRDLVRRSIHLFGQRDNAALKFRSNVFLPDRDRLVLQYAYKMNRDRDRAISFGHETGLTGACFRDRKPWICNLQTLRGAVEARPGEFEFGMSLAEHRKVRDDRTWLLSVPIFDPRDCSPRPPARRDVRVDRGSTYLASQVENRTDGAVFGVLNLDAAFTYREIHPDSEQMLTDPRIQSTIVLVESAAYDIGMILADAFAVLKR